MQRGEDVVICLSGRGDKDVQSVADELPKIGPGIGWDLRCEYQIIPWKICALYLTLSSLADSAILSHHSDILHACIHKPTHSIGATFVIIIEATKSNENLFKRVFNCSLCPGLPPTHSTNC